MPDRGPRWGAAARASLVPMAVAGLLLAGAGQAVAQPAPVAAAPAPVVPGPESAPVVPAPPAPVEPAAPAVPADPAIELPRVQQEAESLTEEWHAAKDELATRRAALGPLRAAVAPARSAVDAAHADEERFRLEIDELALAAFETGNLDPFNALLASGSPDDFLEQMSTLETVSADQRATLDKLRVVIDRTRRAQADADAAVARAEVAADQAARAERDIAARKKAADTRITEVQRLLGLLDPEQRRERLGPQESGPAGPITGSGVGVAALRAAQAQLGKPYRFGAEGPGSFDCSGLMLWAFGRAGVNLPRSSRSQFGVGRSVAFDELRPGDLVFFHSPISHVGIYAGGGKMINAPQTGDVVRYSRVAGRGFSGARRL